VTLGSLTRLDRLQQTSLPSSLSESTESAKPLPVAEVITLPAPPAPPPDPHAHLPSFKPRRNIRSEVFGLDLFIPVADWPANREQYLSLIDEHATAASLAQQKASREIRAANCQILELSRVQPAAAIACARTQRPSTQKLHEALEKERKRIQTECNRRLAAFRLLPDPA
jgi:hypothetical protein